MADYPWAGGEKPDMSKFTKDKRGRYLVPDDWKPHPNFTGTVITKSGMEISYPGEMIGPGNLTRSRTMDKIMGANRSRPWAK